MRKIDKMLWSKDEVKPQPLPMPSGMLFYMDFKYEEEKKYDIEEDFDIPTNLEKFE